MENSTTGPGSNNPGNILASAVDSEVAKFRELQSELNQLRSDLQLLRGQETENEMVAAELDLHSSITGGEDVGEPGPVYKMIGPVLMRQEFEDAQQTVKKRLEFIKEQRASLESKIEQKEKDGDQLATKIQQMQAHLQQTTADAVRAIAQQHATA